MYGAIRSTHLRPVSKISIFGERSRNAGGSRWIGQRSASAGDLAFAVDRLPDHVPEPAERRLPDGHRDRRARVDDLEAPREAVGRVHRDRAHAVVAEVLLHLRDERPVSQLDLERAQDLGEVARGTLRRARRP
jgi:hypothetical protein